jgi:radical SAM superfamily enzyme YgiQ (UPF0313 family)
MKIGLFPMSGIRVCDTELLELGLTLPGFVERSKTIAALPSLGLLTLAGMTPERHQIRYIEVPDEREITDLPHDLDLAVISSYSAQIDEAYALGARFKAIGVPTVIGGPHVTALPDEAAQHCDAVVVGEGEAVWLDVLSDAELGKLKPIYRRDCDDYDLADAPMPAFELLDISKYNRLTIQTSRGCPHRCEFCAGSVLLTSKYKQKPVAKVLAEVEKILTIWDRPFIEFADDNSFVDHAYWKELLPQLKGKGLKWFAETDISVAEDGELLDLMRDSGCAQVLIGLESPVEDGLRGLELHDDWKLKMFPRYRQAIRAIQARGITVNGCFIIGLDGHTVDIFEQVFSFVQDSELYEVQITLQTPFPGTPLYDRLEREGRLIEPDNWKACTLFDLNYEPALMSADELVAGFRKLAVDLYSQEITQARRQRYMHFMKEQLSKREAQV